MHKNCLPSVKHRVDQLRASLSFCEKPLKDENDNLIYTPSQGDQLHALLQSAIDSNAAQPLCQNRADAEARKLVKDANNIFVALLKLFDSMTFHVAGEETATMLESLSIHCWIIGMSETLRRLAKDKVGPQDVMIKAANLGEYIQGSSLLYLLVGNEKMRRTLQSFEIFAVPPMADRQVELRKDWSHIIETIYHRVKGHPIDITRKRMFSVLQAQVIAYTKFDGKFVCHAEVRLIEYLMSQKHSPTIIGISRLSCALCDQWIKAINDKSLIKWKVHGCDGIYPWARDINAGQLTACAEARVQAFVYHELVEFITKFIPDGGQSPQCWNLTNTLRKIPALL